MIKIRTKTAIMALTMLFAFNNTKAVENSKQPRIQEILIQGSIGCLVATAAMYQCNNSFRPFPNNKGVFVSYGLDPKMLYQGGYDMTTKVGYEGGKYEVFLQNEYFSALDDGYLDYYAHYGMGANRVIIGNQMSIFMGIEGNVIDRGLDVFYLSYGANMVFRYELFKKGSKNGNLTLDYNVNCKTRPDTSKKYMINSTFSLRYKFNFKNTRKY